MPVEPDVLGDVVLDESEAAPRLDGGQVVSGSGDEVVHADDIPEMRADEPRAARDEHPHRDSYVWRTGLRPIEWYSNPKRRMRSASQMLRPSKTTGRRITPRRRSRLRNLNSFHSVMSATPSAPDRKS